MSRLLVRNYSISLDGYAAGSSGSSPSLPGPLKAATARGKGRGLSTTLPNPHSTHAPSVSIQCILRCPVYRLAHMQLTTAQESILTISTGGGFNWSDALHEKTWLSPSFSSANLFTSNPARNRSSTSITTPEPPKEMPKPAPAPQKFKIPDHLGERMLRGDFMMD